MSDNEDIPDVSAEVEAVSDLVDQLQTQRTPRWNQQIGIRIRGQGRRDRGPRQGQGQRVYQFRAANSGFVFNCLTCNQYAFHASSLHVVGRYPVLAALDTSLPERCRYRPHPRIQNFRMLMKAWLKEHKFSCRFCGRDWGITGKQDNVFLHFVKIVNFFVINDKGLGAFYKKWHELPLQFDKMTQCMQMRYMEDASSRTSAFVMTVDDNSRDTTATSTGTEVTISASSFPWGGGVAVKIDPLAFCVNVNEVVSQHEQVVTPGIELVASPKQQNVQLNKYMCLKVEHNAKVLDNVKVYKTADRRQHLYNEVERVEQENEENQNESDDQNTAEELQQQEAADGDADELHATTDDSSNAQNAAQAAKHKAADSTVQQHDKECFTIDKRYVYIYTNTLAAYICTEANVQVAIPQRCVVAVLVRGQDGTQAAAAGLGAGSDMWGQHRGTSLTGTSVQVYVYDEEAVMVQHVDRFISEKFKDGYRLADKRNLDLPSEVSKHDLILCSLSARPKSQAAEARSSAGGGAVIPQGKKVGHLFGLSLRRTVPCRSVAFPQLLVQKQYMPIQQDREVLFVQLKFHQVHEGMPGYEQDLSSYEVDLS